METDRDIKIILILSLITPVLLPNYITSFTLDSIVSRRSSAHIRASRVQLDVTFTTKTHNVSTTIPTNKFSPVSKTPLI